MPHTTKKQRIEDHPSAMVTANDDFSVSFDDLGVEVLANILAFLPPKDIMSKRSINKKSTEAVKKTIVPLTNFRVNNMRTYNALNVMTRAMPNLQQITLSYDYFGRRHKWSDGEDPDEEEAARTANMTPLHIGIISNFRKLLSLDIYGCASLNGRYPFLFSSFPLLQKLSIENCDYLKWDLGMLAGFPLLKEFHSDSNDHLTGNINSLGVLKDTLEKVEIRARVRCSRVEGNFMDLADFPRLKALNLTGTAVTGDIRDIGENDFSSLEELMLPKGVYGGRGYEMQRISDAPDLIGAVYLFKKQRPSLKMDWDWFAYLSRDSPDWYDRADDDTAMSPPFRVCFVQAGSRIGYRWEGGYHNVCPPCEVNWLDPEPESGSREYEDYVSGYRRIQREISLYRGHYEPPTEEQYIILYEEVRFQGDDEDYWDYEGSDADGESESYEE